MTNRVKINEFKEGQHLRIPLLIKSIIKGVTNSGATYLTLHLQDSSGTIEAKLWDAKPEAIKTLESGKVYEFEGEIYDYRKNLQFKILKYYPLVQTEINLDEFVTKSSISVDDLRNYISDTLASFQNETIKRLVKTMLQSYDHDFYTYPAASKIHHNFMGGLATHTVSMLKLGDSLCELYPILNREILLGAIILHDLGKINELGGNFVNEYTVEGRLLGHISIGQAKLYEIAVQLGLEKTEELMLLRHMILSHHGEYEYGSPVKPMTIEAEILTYIDNIDARLNTLEQELSKTNSGEFSSKIFSLDGRSFYHHRLNNK